MSSCGIDNISYLCCNEWVGNWNGAIWEDKKSKYLKLAKNDGNEVTGGPPTRADSNRLPQTQLCWLTLPFTFHLLCGCCCGQKYLFTMSPKVSAMSPRVRPKYLCFSFFFFSYIYFCRFGINIKILVLFSIIFRSFC